MTTDLSAAAGLLDQDLGYARELKRQLDAGEITQAQYRIAYEGHTRDAETGPRCDVCGAAAYVGSTCAAHTSEKAIAAAARAYARKRPAVDICRYPDRERFTAAVEAAFRAAGHFRQAGHWARRAEQAPGMDALVQLARELNVRIERSL